MKYDVLFTFIDDCMAQEELQIICSNGTSLSQVKLTIRGILRLDFVSNEDESL